MALRDALTKRRAVALGGPIAVSAGAIWTSESFEGIIEHVGSIRSLGFRFVACLYGFPGFLWKLGVQRLDLFGPRNPVFDYEVDHLEQAVRDFWRAIDLDFAWMDGVVPNDTAKIQGLLDFHRQSLGDQAADVIVDVLAFFIKSWH